MNQAQKKWDKKELKIYILLLCANIDNDESKAEIELIKSKIDLETFDRLYKEFSKDDEDTRFEKIEDSINHHEYSPIELNALRKEIMEVFNSDNKFLMKEQNLDRVFDNILY